MKQQSPFGENRSLVNVAVQRPTVNSTVGANIEAGDSQTANTEPLLTFSRHATFGPTRSHPLETI